MKCESCGKEYSKSVWKIHAIDCAKKQIKVAQIADKDVKNYSKMSFNDLRQEAKELGLKTGKNPTMPELIKELTNYNNE